MKIAYLITEYPKVSHSFIRREILALESSGVEVMRIALRGWDADTPDAQDARERDRTSYVLKRGLWSLLAAFMRSLARNPRRLLGSLRLALVMSRGADRPLPYHLVYLLEACWVALKVSREPVVHMHAHFGTNAAEVAMLAHVLSGLPYSFTAHGKDEIDRNKFIGLGEKIRRAAFVVAVSSFGRSQLFRWVEPQHWSKIEVVHCGLEQSFYDVPQVPIPERPRLLCIGRLSSEKGHRMLIEAAGVLASDGVQFELVLAGDGDMRPELEERIAALGLQRQIRITGWVSSEQVREEIQAARALVLPSFTEGLPIVIMEAMALRRPVLATYVGGIPELVIHGQHGWLFPAGAAPELACAMKTCLSAPTELLIDMGNRARDRVLERHDIVTQAARLATLFQGAASATKSGGVL